MDGAAGKLEQIKGIEGRRGIRHILEEGRRILGNPILVHDMEYKVVAHTENGAVDDPIWNEFVTTGTVGPERMEFYRDENFFDMVANAKKVTYLFSKKLKYNRIFGKLFAGGNLQVGCVCMVACENPFSPEEPMLFNALCDVLDRALSRSKFYQDYGQRFLKETVALLIEGGIDDKALYSANLECVYVGLRENLYLGVVNAGARNLNPVQIRDLFKRTRRSFKYVVYQNYVLIIAGTDHHILRPERDLKGLLELLEACDLRVGFSDCFENLYELATYYRQALDALRTGRPHCDGRVLLPADAES